MDSTAEERLKRLQMADLGTARREYISTVDSKAKQLERMRLEDIEAARLSNVAGTDAQRMAERNKSKLSEWANVYKKLGDTQGLEHLDNLLDGQSHRVQLNSIVRESGGQIYSKEAKRNDNFLEVTGSAPPKRRERSSGRGGGIIGTRGRGSIVPSSGRTNQGAVAKLGHHVVESPHQRSCGLDPALDPDKDQKNRGCQNNSDKSKRGDKKPAPAFLKNRRVVPLPTGDYSRLLSAPDDFLAIARRIVNTKTSSDDTASVVTQTSVVAPSDEQAQVKDTGEQSKAASAKDIDSHASQKHGDTTPSCISVADSKSIEAERSILDDTPTPETDRSPALGPSTPAPVIPEADGRSEVTNLTSSGQDAPVSKSKSEPIPIKVPLLKGLASNLPQPIQSRKEGMSKEREADKPRVEETDLLVDFGSSPEDSALTTPLPSKEQNLLRSPAFEDLQGIDFSVPAAVDTVSSKSLSPGPSFNPTRNLDFQEPVNEKKDSEAADTSHAEKEPLSKYRREISIIDNLIETTSLSDEFLYKLKDCRKELESKLHQNEQLSTANPASSAQEQQQQADNRKQLTSKLQSTPSLESPLKHAVTASPFVPRNPSFTTYRSPTHSVSSDSSSLSSPPIRPPIFKPTPPNPSPIIENQEPSDSSHIIGDHLLPGRRARQDSLPKSGKLPLSEQASDKPKVQFSIPQRSVLSEARLPIFEGFGGTSSTNSPETRNGTTLFSPNPESKPFTPISVYPPESNKEVFNAPTTKLVAPSLTLEPRAVRAVDSNVSHSLQQSTHCPKPHQQSIHAPKPLQQSIHAPKLLQQSINAPKPHPYTGGSVSGGLQDSIWATAENHKPLR